MTERIGGVNITAPMWRDASREDLWEIVKLLSSASYHYADDSAKEWGAARSNMADAAAKVNALKLRFCAMRKLYEHTHQLFDFDSFADAVLLNARADKGVKQ